jgi:hypothetical protein
MLIIALEPFAGDGILRRHLLPVVPIGSTAESAAYFACDGRVSRPKMRTACGAVDCSPVARSVAGVQGNVILGRSLRHREVDPGTLVIPRRRPGVQSVCRLRFRMKATIDRIDRNLATLRTWADVA